MTTALLSLSDDTVELHDGWSQIWAPTFTDTKLRRDLFHSPRFQLRVLEMLSGTPGAGDIGSPHSNVESTDDLDSIAELNSESGFRSLGLAWYAPRLLLDLFDPANTGLREQISNDDVARIRPFADHIDPAVLAEPAANADFAEEGKKCLIVWLHGRSARYAARIRLQLPPEAILQIPHQVERAELVGRVIAAGPDAAMLRAG